MSLRAAWCWLFHRQYRHENIIWNGRRTKWMNWCGDCGDWRPCSRQMLESKMAAIMIKAKERGL